MSTESCTPGQNVLDLMKKTGGLYSQQGLLEVVTETFGKECLFFLGEMQNLTAERLIDILMARGIFVGTPTAFRYNSAGNHQI